MRWRGCLAVDWSLHAHAAVRPTGRALALLRRQRLVGRLGDAAITFEIPAAEAVVTT